MVEQQVSVHNEVTAETYETDYEIPCTSRVCGRRKCRKLRRWVFVCVRARECVCEMSLAALRVRCPVSSRSLVVSVSDTHEADTS